MSVLIKGGRIVTAADEYVGDVFIDNGTISLIGESLDIVADKVIEGVTCVVVHDSLYLRGKLAEKTIDWYAQDRRGNVWYFGEATEELDCRGRVTSTEGSWQAGVDGAKPGIFMPAHPRVGASLGVLQGPRRGPRPHPRPV